MALARRLPHLMSEADHEHNMTEINQRPRTRFVALCEPDSRLLICPDGRIMIISPNKPPRYLNQGLNEFVVLTSLLNTHP